MTLSGEPGRFVVIDGDGSEIGHLRLTRWQGITYLHDLAAADPAALRLLIRVAVHVAKRGPVHFPVGDGPQYDRLRHIAIRLGGHKAFEVWTSQENTKNGN